MSEISKTSMFMSRLATLKQGQSTEKSNSVKSPADGAVPARPTAVQNNHNLTEPVTIVVSSLNEKVQDLQKLLDKVEKSISTLASSRDHVQNAVGLLEEAGGITIRARDTLKTAAGYEGNKDRLVELEDRFTAVLEKLDNLVNSAISGDVNLLKGETLTTTFDAEGKNQFNTTGLNLSPEALEFRNPDFSSLEKVQDARIDVMNAIDIGTTLRHIISSDLMLLQTRQEFSQSTISTLAEGAQSIPVADLGDEAANLLALQIRQQLTDSDIQLAAESQQHLLRQF